MKNSRGETPIDWAVSNQRKGVVEILEKEMEADLFGEQRAHRARLVIMLKQVCVPPNLYLLHCAPYIVPPTLYFLHCASYAVLPTLYLLLGVRANTVPLTVLAT